MSDLIRPGTYKHYKGGLYWVIGVGMHADGLGPHVLYQALSGEPKFYVRPLSVFKSTVTINGKEIPRYTRESGTL